MKDNINLDTLVNITLEEIITITHEIKIWKQRLKKLQANPFSSTEEIKDTINMIKHYSEKIMTNQNNKYYTPSIEEFHIGFRYEQYDTIDGKSGTPLWIKKEVYHSFGAFDDDIDALEEEFIRVKYLDKEDIEELGWKITKEYTLTWEAQIEGNKFDFYQLTYDFREKILCIEYFYQTKMINKDIGIKDCNTLFQGTIKNYNELKTLMNQLDIK